MRNPARIIAPVAAFALLAAAATAQDETGLTAEETANFRDAVLACWTVAPKSPASRIAVTLAFAMDAKGQPRAETIRLTGQKGGGSSVEIASAVETARRAVLRCAGDGYDLPPEKYAHWKNIVMEFVPLTEATK